MTGTGAALAKRACRTAATIHGSLFPLPVTVGVGRAPCGPTTTVTGGGTSPALNSRLRELLAGKPGLRFDDFGYRSVRKVWTATTGVAVGSIGYTTAAATGGAGECKEKQDQKLFHSVGGITQSIESPDVFQATAAAIILSNQTPTRMTTGP
jgi:hypothetical protein